MHLISPIPIDSTSIARPLRSLRYHGFGRTNQFLVHEQLDGPRGEALRGRPRRVWPTRSGRTASCSRAARHSGPPTSSTSCWSCPTGRPTSPRSATLVRPARARSAFRAGPPMGGHCRGGRLGCRVTACGAPSTTATRQMRVAAATRSPMPIRIRRDTSLSSIGVGHQRTAKDLVVDLCRALVVGCRRAGPVMAKYAGEERLGRPNR